MSNNKKPNIGAVMTLVHNSVTRGLDISKNKVSHSCRRDIQALLSAMDLQHASGVWA